MNMISSNSNNEMTERKMKRIDNTLFYILSLFSSLISHHYQCYYHYRRNQHHSPLITMKISPLERREAAGPSSEPRDLEAKRRAAMLDSQLHVAREVPMFRGVRGPLTCISQPPTNEERRSRVDAFKEEDGELIPLRPAGSASFGGLFGKARVGFPF